MMAQECLVLFQQIQQSQIQQTAEHKQNDERFARLHHNTVHQFSMSPIKEQTDDVKAPTAASLAAKAKQDKQKALQGKTQNLPKSKSNCTLLSCVESEDSQLGTPPLHDWHKYPFLNLALSTELILLVWSFRGLKQKCMVKGGFLIGKLRILYNTSFCIGISMIRSNYSLCLQLCYIGILQSISFFETY